MQFISKKTAQALAILTVLLVLVTFTDGPRLFSPLMNVAATLATGAAYGEQLGQTVDDVVNSIHATVPGSFITHADVLAIMCVEQGGVNANLRTSITSGAGAKGLTQVMPGTFSDYKKNNWGGFSQLNCEYSQIQTNPRCSIEAGARIFNYLLIQYDGNRTTAARAYNGGPGRAYGSLPTETRQYAYERFPKCFNAILAGQPPVASSVWRAMVQKVSALTGGLFKLAGSGQLVPFSASGWADVASDPAQRLQDIANGWFNNSGSGNNPIASLLGLPQSSGGGSGSSGGGASGSRGSSSTQPPIIRDTTSPGSILDDSGVFDFISNTSIPATGPTNASTGVSQGQSIYGTDPTLFCVPNPVESGESALLMWACRDGAVMTEGENFDTEKKLIGKAFVTPTKDTTYTVSCINDIPNVEDTERSCIVEVTNPALAIIPSSHSVARGQSIKLSWKTADTTECTLTSSEHPTFNRSGIEGEATSPTLTQATTFVLTCETTTGSLREKAVDVKVQ